MKESIKKASILVEAIPYLKAFKDKVVVIKYGGSALDDVRARRGILKDIIFMNAVGIRPVLVHGGGPEITKRMKRLGKKVKFIRGLRATDAAVMNIVDAALTKVNKLIVKEAQQLNGNAKSLLAKNHNLVTAKPISKELGFAGVVDKVNARRIRKVLKKGYIPVISSVGRRNKHLYNINADIVAASVAAALNAEKFVLFTNVEGILMDKDRRSSMISSLSKKGARRLMKAGVIDAGMIPKVKACINALEDGVKKAHIIGVNMPHSLLLEIFTKEGIGTQIVK